MPSDELKRSESTLRAAQDRLQRRRMGAPLKLSDADLDKLVETGPEIVPELVAYARSTAGTDAVGLIEAEEEEVAP